MYFCPHRWKKHRKELMLFLLLLFFFGWLFVHFLRGRLETEIHKQLGKVLLSFQITRSSTGDSRLRWDKTQFPDAPPLLCAPGYRANTDIWAVMYQSGVRMWLGQQNLVSEQCHDSSESFPPVPLGHHRNTFILSLTFQSKQGSPLSKWSKYPWF